MKKIYLGCLLLLYFTPTAMGQIITDVPENKSNNRFLNDASVISMRPGLSISGFSNEGERGLGLQQILNEAMDSKNSSAYLSVSQILEKAKDPISLNPDVGQIEYTTNILQYLAFETLASLVLEQNGIDSEQSKNTYGLTIGEHSMVIDKLTNAINSLTSNDKLVRKLPGDQPFDDYLNAIRSFNNMARALDLYLATENAYQHYGLDDSSLLTEQEKTDLMNRFRADIDILFNNGLKREYGVGGLFTVTEDHLEAGNRPMKGYFALAYASMSAQTATQEELGHPGRLYFNCPKKSQ
ncbi:MAG: hypothetical protein U5K72_04950 [Balneolaceae bacterium]|nr:hypothetical protein [Balneolaceae bacterium]